MTTIPSLSFAQGSLENPVAGSTESGIGVISGWHCTASNITVTMDGASLGKAGSGTGRGDTAGICGRVDTGYSLLFNYNDLTPGSHSISAYADGQLLETRQFNTVQSGGSAFVTGLSKTATVSDFPSSGKTATLQWSEAKQGFVVTGITEIGGGGNSSVDLSSLQGTYSITENETVSGSSCASLGETNGTFTYSANVTTSGNTVRIVTSEGADSCIGNLTYVSGNSTSGFNMNGSVLCGSVSTSLTAAGLRKINNQLHGIYTLSFPGCVATNSF
ncbi:MAG: hypothetical protein M3P47_02565 [Pseudomonadota bacterium]|nr:hypothetical protein [Pseudomonadota bacterium]